MDNIYTWRCISHGSDTFKPTINVHKMWLLHLDVIRKFRTTWQDRYFHSLFWWYKFGISEAPPIFGGRERMFYVRRGNEIFSKIIFISRKMLLWEVLLLLYHVNRKPIKLFFVRNYHTLHVSLHDYTYLSFYFITLKPYLVIIHWHFIYIVLNYSII
jgi:hypothetical protein